MQKYDINLKNICVFLVFSYLCHQNAKCYGCKTNIEVPETVIG